MNNHQNEDNEKEVSKNDKFLGKKTNRGRPPKKIVLDGIKENYKKKDDSFCKNDIRLKKDNEKIELPEIKEELNKIKNIFSKEKPENIPNELINLNKIEVDKYFIIKFWDEKEEAKEKNEKLDKIFVQYLKEYSQKVNKDYFFLMVKLFVFLREYINSKKNLIEINKKKNPNSKKNEENSDELYVANIVKNLGNDFFILFLGKKRGENTQTLFKFFEMENIPDIKNELKELYINLCYWLKKNNCSDSFLIEYEDASKKSDDDEKPKKNNKKKEKKKFNVE